MSALEAAVAELEARYTAAHPASRARHEAALAVMPGGNTRSSAFFPPFPLTFRRGAGQWLEDLDGHRLLDYAGDWSAGLFGHADPVILDAIREALEGGLTLGGPNRWEAELAAAIVARFPSIERVRFCNSGTEANLFALLAAQAFTGRTTILGCEGGYHGSMLFFGYANALKLPFDLRLVPYNDADAAEAVLRAEGDRIAAVIVEPLMGSGGSIAGDPEFLHLLRRECDRCGALLILDEVVTSRMGPGGMQERLGLRADLVALGKWLGGGQTFGAFGGRADILDRFDPRRADAWPHAGTFNHNPTSMAAGLAGLTRVFTPERAEALHARGKALRQRLQAVVARHNVPVQITGAGSMLGIHPQAGPIRRPQDITVGTATRALMHLDLIEQGLFLARRATVPLMLPQREADDERLCAAFDGFLARYGPLIAA